ncbi:MAG: glycoside hydrolase family 17 protein, partial [Gammaproteobacteria bacterium]
MSLKTKIASVFGLSMLIFLNFSIWSHINNPLQLKSWNRPMMGVTFSPMRRDYTPENRLLPSAAEIEEDMKLLSGKVHAIRIYTVGEGQDVVPELALKHHLNVAVGAWIGADRADNRREIESLIEIGRSGNPNIVRLLVGNETLLRKDVSMQQLIAYLREVRARTWRPVSTSETWDTWLAHPELTKEVDYLGVHILPYWEGLSVDVAVDYVFDRYRALRKRYPGKPIVITEVGWPSDGQSFKHAVASRT